jgi:hypothetical protein
LREREREKEEIEEGMHVWFVRKRGEMWGVLK